ncbi:hypothetical protein I7I53_08940 [Histoplasma capsulatum var. duboisii H88]|uniref:Integrase catalytic domain-containing protein n=1 Tax=Ajellomyces capsulatus (strain H88) TaxID=544711 RepID=A0A8A1L7U5_AJEC8|nr:hypothetical protein I7I53_08940 [Histoplasma capsulatum var. duboisii H88]
MFEPSEEQVYTGDSTTKVMGYGTVWTYMTNSLGKQFQVILKNAVYILNSHTNLIAWKPCYHIEGIYFDGKMFRLRRIRDDSIFACIEVYDGLLVTEYHRTSENNTLALANIAPPSNSTEHAKITEPPKISVPAKSNAPLYIPKSSTASSKIWHQHLGHPSMRAVEHLSTNAKGVQISDIKDITKDEDKELCEPCHLAKAKNQISRRPHVRSKLPFECLHADILQGPSYCYNREQWLIHFVCDYLQFHIAVTAIRKSDIRKVFNKVLRWIKHQFDCETKIIQIDNEKAVKESDIFKEWVTDLDLDIEYSSEYIHEQNGAAEWVGAIITSTARTLRIESLLPQSLFPEIAITAVYLLNRTSIKILEWKSPLRALEDYLHIEHHSCAHLHAYGCRAYAKIPNEILNRNRSQKLNPRAHIEYLVGYDSTNIFQIWIPHLDRVIRARDVIFDENRKYNPDEPHIEKQL